MERSSTPDSGARTEPDRPRVSERRHRCGRVDAEDAARGSPSLPCSRPDPVRAPPIRMWHAAAIIGELRIVHELHSGYRDNFLTPVALFSAHERPIFRVGASNYSGFPLWRPWPAGRVPGIVDGNHAHTKTDRVGRPPAAARGRPDTDADADADAPQPRIRAVCAVQRGARLTFGEPSTTAAVSNADSRMVVMGDQAGVGWDRVVPDWLCLSAASASEVLTSSTGWGRFRCLSQPVSVSRCATDGCESRSASEQITTL